LSGKPDAVQGILSFIAFEIFIVSAIIQYVQKADWVWFGLSLLAFALMNGILGWVLIEAFNRHQRRRRRRRKAAGPDPALCGVPADRPKG
jgi:Kef-type K+ transport system membrane component KefB